ncbi:diaminohydroxyphosphoribosylaminopyrimidine deaminase / 5-amino-6-(5-phosphoribosylamino)uracil reductase [Campylobacter iguaniorum]|uniref:bifunctional diaminohydroxyphosphoribosylaminopyrimidine deaminase/5-amino-6-(5-phosphoribosylamino)uracil reductase RibD n=1 Tax=Campylobacter iguaniorum TaxID=1244531 RepID=UPI00073A469B|nr:bifunctional diaminohydroxyphosphoribosylaminopyrimidine deaminase/5-amino-6-(5-phosphoribosylamino)uracil reductase RibD [Campylobacter iguaniorum]ALV23987.1 diaminohydroxyphosphoribosylaminopyrimidine deaminase / 5-amino-6-(5-phosphoribosylamino)uracil reductase [Campylobacter iguaniorum]
MNDEFYMNLAIDEAWKYQFLTYPNPAVGCLILSKNGEILSCEAHQKAGMPHAELNAVISALQRLNPNLKAVFKTAKNANELYVLALQNHANLLSGARAYVSLEPCSHHGKTPPCANLLKELGFAKVIIATKDVSEYAKGGEQVLNTAGISTQIGVCKDRADELLEPFWAWSNGNFSFFKIALTQNGVASGGIISNHASRTHTHAIRSLASLLVIGGNTVRTDRPTLDTRLINGGKNPEVLIYSNETKFDTSIPLFSIKDRKVTISNSLEAAFERHFVMFEGGGNALSNLDKRVKWLLIYRSNEFKDAKNISLNLKIKIMHRAEFDDNELLWCKIIN